MSCVATANSQRISPGGVSLGGGFLRMQGVRTASWLPPSPQSCARRRPPTLDVSALTRDIWLRPGRAREPRVRATRGAPRSTSSCAFGRPVRLVSFFMATGRHHRGASIRRPSRSVHVGEGSCKRALDHAYAEPVADHLRARLLLRVPAAGSRRTRASNLERSTRSRRLS